MEKMLLIVNPISGGKDKKKVIQAIENGLDKSRFQWDIAFTEYSGHGTILARESDADIVVAVGGDGTVSEVAKGISGTGKTLGIIPCGSGDGLALHLGISRNLPKAVRQLNDSRQAIIDYGTIDGKLFFCTTGVGMDAEVAWEFAKAGTRGLKTYVCKTLSVWRHYVPKEYRLEIDGEPKSIRATFITVANINQWGNNAEIAPEASVTDGLFDITVLLPFHIWDIPGLALRLFSKQFTKSRKVLSFRGRNVVIHHSEPMIAHFDGDPIEMGSDIHIDIHPKSIRMLIPQGGRHRV